MSVPESPAVRERLKQAATAAAAQRDASHTLSRDELNRLGRQLLVEQQLPEGYLGYTMVLLGNAVWQPQLLSVPFRRRLLLLPSISVHSPGCGVRVNMLRSSWPSPKPQIGPTRSATASPNSFRTRWSWPL